MNRWFIMVVVTIAVALVQMESCAASAMMADPPYIPLRDRKLPHLARTEKTLARIDYRISVNPSWVIWTMDAGHWDPRDLDWLRFWLFHSLEPKK